MYDANLLSRLSTDMWVWVRYGFHDFGNVWEQLIRLLGRISCVFWVLGDDRSFPLSIPISGALYLGTGY